MDDSDKVIENELADLGGEFGGIGARWAARQMPNNAFRASIELDMEPGRAVTKLIDVAGSLGRIIGRDITDDGGRLTAVIPAGFWNLNPAVVDLEIMPLGTHSCRVVITGTAKEGLIKQRAGEGAVKRILAATGFGSLDARDIPRP